MNDADKKYEERIRTQEHERKMEKLRERKKTFRFIAYLATIILLFLAFGPTYGVWSQRLSGAAELARAESSRQIRVLEARAEQEAAKALAEAEVIRAEGVAKANKIIGESLQNNEGYLRYLWVQGLQSNQMQVVYVPTEANLPILEANRNLIQKK